MCGRTGGDLPVLLRPDLDTPSWRLDRVRCSPSFEALLRAKAVADETSNRNQLEPLTLVRHYCLGAWQGYRCFDFTADTSVTPSAFHLYPFQQL